jgi:hypothetical protein
MNGDNTPNPDTATPGQGLPPGAIVKPLGPPPGSVIKPLPTSTPAPTPAAAATTGATISGPQAEPSLIHGLRALHLHPLAGFVQEGAGTLIGLHDLDQKINRRLGLDQPNPEQQALEAQGLHPTDNPILGAIRRTANAPEAEGESWGPARVAEAAGKAGENVAEFLSGDEILSLIGDVAKGSKLMKGAAQLSSTLEQYPRIAKLVRLGLDSVRYGGESGAQTLVKTGGDVEAAKQAAFTTAAITPAVGVLGEGANAFLKEHGATQENIGGVNMTIPGAVRRAKPTPQQEQGQEAIAGAARKSLAGHLAEVNESRALPPSPPALPARTGPYEFNLRGIPPTETAEGQGTVRAADFPRSHSRVVPGATPEAANVQELGTQAKAVPERMLKREKAYLTSERPGETPETVTTRGAGTLTTQDPNIARQHIANLNDVVDHPDFGRLPAAQQQDILDARSEAQNQMREYHDHMQPTNPRYGVPNFAPVDIPREIAKVGSYTEAADSLENIATSGYNHISDALALNDISGGKFNMLREANKSAWQAYKGASTEQGLHVAEQQIDETNRLMQKMLETDIGGAVTQKELAGMNDAYGSAQRLRYVANAVDQSFTGNRAADAKPWEYVGFNGDKLMQGLNGLERKFGGRAALERTVGKENLDTLYQVASLNRNPAGMKKFGEAVNNVAEAFKNISQHLHVGPLALGGAAAHVAGIPWEYGAAGGWASAVMGRHIIDAVLSNPRISTNLIYAIEHGVKPSYYGPAIAAMVQQYETSKHKEAEPNQ